MPEAGKHGKNEIRKGGPMLNRWKAIGPGLLMAGIAIGVSHLVQSTRAGANFGFQLVGVILLINVLKYPFFEYGHRYAAVKGETLLHGYKRMGTGYLVAFLIMQLIAALAGVAAVTGMTAALAENVLSLGLHHTVWSALLMAACITILLIGDYKWLDVSMKGIMAVLALATISACVMALFRGPAAPPGFSGPSPWTIANIGFLLALMGWMPAPIEISVYQSLWVNARDEAKGRKTTMEEARFDFNAGYSISLVMALIFLTLGAFAMHGTGEKFAENGVEFAAQLVLIYQKFLGGWAGPLVALAAFATMFSTTLTVIDANPRALSMGTKLAFTKWNVKERKLRWSILLVGCLIELIILHFWGDGLKRLIDVAITIGFLAGPVFAWLNYRLITSSHVPAANQPGVFLRCLSWLGIAFFVFFGLFYLLYRFGGLG